MVKYLNYQIYITNYLLNCIQGNYKEEMPMKKNIINIAKMITLSSILGLVIAGCSAKSDLTAKKTFDENWRFVPRVHVEDNSFGVTSNSQYWGCSYDTYHEGYWCPMNR